MNKIKVCHLTTAHNSNDIRIFQKECTYIAKNDLFDVYLVAKGKSRTENNVKVIGIDKEYNRYKRMLLFSKEIFKKALSLDCDIYHIHDPELLPYARKLKKKNKKVIFDSHENVSEQILIKDYIPYFFRKMISKIYKIYENFIVKKLDSVIFPCTINGLHPFENTSKKSIIVANYPIIDMLDIDINNIDNTDSMITFAYVGSLSENRGVTVLLEAFAKVNNKCRLILAGDFESNEYRKNLEDKGLLNNVDYRGFCNTDEVNMIYREAQVGISNLLNIGQYHKLDTFPTKVFEYMINSMAVIVSDYSFAKTMIDKYKFGVCVDPSSVDELVNAMIFFIENPHECISMGNKGKLLGNEKFNWQNESNKLIALYRSIIDITK